MRSSQRSIVVEAEVDPVSWTAFTTGACRCLAVFALKTLISWFNDFLFKSNAH
jgi:hypothetical protein